MEYLHSKSLVHFDLKVRYGLPAVQEVYLL